jgi:filamentous hemagglutinin
MRADMIAQSKKDPFNDGSFFSGLSNGVNGDGVKLGGARVFWLNGTLYEVVAPLGGLQSEPGLFFGSPYLAGSWQDNLVEQFAGPHDWISSVFYTSAGDGVPWMAGGFGAAVGTAYSALALIPAAGIVGMAVAPEIPYAERAGRN